MFVVAGLITIIVLFSIFVINKIGAGEIVIAKETNYIVDLAHEILTILKDLLLIIVGILSSIFARMFGFGDPKMNGENKK